MFHAVTHGCPLTIKVLAEYGADLNAVDKARVISLFTLPSIEGSDIATVFANYCVPCSGNETDTEGGHCQRFVYVLSGSFTSTL